MYIKVWYFTQNLGDAHVPLVYGQACLDELEHLEPVGAHGCGARYEPG